MSINGDQITGKAKQGLGKLTGNQKLKTEGKMQEITGDIKAKARDTEQEMSHRMDDIQTS